RDRASPRSRRLRPATRRGRTPGARLSPRPAAHYRSVDRDIRGPATRRYLSDSCLVLRRRAEGRHLVDHGLGAEEHLVDHLPQPALGTSAEHRAYVAGFGPGQATGGALDTWADRLAAARAGGQRDARVVGDTLDLPSRRPCREICLTTHDIDTYRRGHA